jgi:hypothetical protein
MTNGKRLLTLHNKGSPGALHGTFDTGLYGQSRAEKSNRHIERGASTSVLWSWPLFIRLTSPVVQTDPLRFCRETRRRDDKFGKRFDRFHPHFA